MTGAGDWVWVRQEQTGAVRQVQQSMLPSLGADWTQITAAEGARAAEEQGR